MKLQNVKELYPAAKQRLEKAPEEKKIILLYAAIIIGMAVLSMGINSLLSDRISQSGGLGNLGVRTFLTTIQSVLPILQSVISLCLGLGYTSAMLRISRGQYATVNSLRLGFQRFWQLLRTTIFQTLIFAGLGILSLYAAMLVFFLTPLSGSAMELVSSLMSGGELQMETLLMDEVMQLAFLKSIAPVYVIFLLMFALLAIPLLYRYRMVSYVLIDNPAVGGLAALRRSSRMMKGNCMALFRLDLHLWWYYALSALAATVAYADTLAALLGISLPVSADVAYYLSFGVYLVAQAALYYFLSNRIEVTYALAYEQIAPKPQENSVVLGNIFQM